MTRPFHLIVSLFFLLLLVGSHGQAHFSLTKRVSDLNVTVELLSTLEHGHEEKTDRMGVGTYEFRLHLLDVAQSYWPVEGANVQLHMAHQGQIQSEVHLEAEGSGIYSGPGRLTKPGAWILRARIAGVRSAVVSAAFELSVATEGKEDRRSDAPGNGSTALWMALAGAAALAAMLAYQMARKGRSKKA